MEENNNGGHSAPNQPSGWSQNQLHQMAQWEIEKGTLNQAQADGMLKSEGVAPLRDANIQAAPLHEVYQAFPPALAEEYDTPLIIAGNDRLTPSGKQFDNQVRSWLSTAGFTKEIGSEIAREWGTLPNNHYSSMTDAEKANWDYEQESKFNRVFGESAPAKLELAAQLVMEIDERHPGFYDFIEEKGFGTFGVIAQLAMQAERMIHAAESREGSR